jgi:hypothetical protein
MNNLIGLYSPLPGCGKTTLANLLLKQGYRLFSFADPLRAMLDGLMNFYDGSEIRDWPKEKVIPTLDTSPRWLMQSLGTEWGRRCIGPTIWVDLMLRRLDQFPGARTVIDDVRFPNEFEALKARGALMVRIERPGIERVGTHVSDGGLELYTFDLELRNDGRPEDMLEQLKEWRGQTCPR